MVKEENLSTLSGLIGERIAVIAGRLKGHGGMVTMVNDSAIGFYDEAKPGERLTWVSLERWRNGEVIIAE